MPKDTEALVAVADLIAKWSAEYPEEQAPPGLAECLAKVVQLCYPFTGIVPRR